MKLENRLRELLGMDIKLEKAKLIDGTELEFESLDSGTQIFIVNGDEKVPLPVGDFELESGQIIVIAEEGIIAEVKEKEAPKDAPVDEVEAAEPEFVTKAEFDELKALVESLVKPEAEKTEMSVDPQTVTVETTTVELSADPEPFVHSPEVKQEIKKITYSQKRPASTFDVVLSKFNK